MLPRLPPLRRPSRNELLLAGATLVVALFASWLRRGEKIAALEQILAAKPLVEEKIKEVRVEGPVRIVEKIVTAADGSCSIERTTDRGATTTSRESDRKETPICPQPHSNKARWGHVLADPAGPYGGQLGLTFWDRLDVGAQGDWRNKRVGVLVGGRF